MTRVRCVMETKREPRKCPLRGLLEGWFEEAMAAHEDCSRPGFTLDSTRVTCQIAQDTFRATQLPAAKAAASATTAEKNGV